VAALLLTSIVSASCSTALPNATPGGTAIPPTVPSVGVVEPSIVGPSAAPAVEATRQPIDSSVTLDVGPFGGRHPAPAATPIARPEAFSIDLYRQGAFASQKTTYYCVPASIQVMQNLIFGRPFDTSRSNQDDLYQLARDYLIQPYWGRGAQPEGWARVVTHDGGGRYELAIRSSARAAIKVAALQLRLTGRPVGLLVWRGYHAWVMSGFTSLGDPAKMDDFTVTGVYVEDPWYPRISRTYGRGQEPDTLLSMRALSRFFLPYDQHGEGGLDKDGKYVVVVPIAHG
jgi:hypothetical protein